MKDIPHSEGLTTVRLARIFRNTVATYKFFWFISILQIHAKENRLKISIWDIVIRMVANAWYPIHYFRLSFGKSDSLFQIVMKLQQITMIPIDAKADTIVDILKGRIGETAVRRELKILTLNVPYRFLRPWINSGDNQAVILRSQALENNCLYALFMDEEDPFIALNPLWDKYLHEHYKLLVDFSYWNLTQFLQVRNPNVPAITNKLIRPETRNSLKRQHDFWNMAISLEGPVKCIYTGREIHCEEYDLDHFMPWSFVSHDLLWNLIPSDPSVNSSKSNKIPDLQRYLPMMAELQHNAITTVVRAGRKPKVMEDYTTIGYTPQELACMSNQRFVELMERKYNPICQIALNMGFETWKME